MLSSNLQCAFSCQRPNLQYGLISHNSNDSLYIACFFMHELFHGRPDSSVGKTVCLCLMTSYIPLPQGFESCWRHASKKYRVVKKNISMKIPAECMSGLTVPAGLWWFHRVFPGQPRTTLAFLHLKTVVQKCIYRSRVAWFDVDSVSLFVTMQQMMRL